MRAHYLVAGLIGLAGLAFAAPTPESTAVSLIPTSQPADVTDLEYVAPECNMGQQPDMWFAAICGNHTNTSTMPKTWLGVCGLLTAGVAHEVTTTVQDPGLMCRFYDDSDYCNSDYLVATLTHHFRIPSAIGKQIKYVRCDKAPPRGDSGEIEARADDALLDDAPFVLGAEDIKHAEEDDALPIHDADPIRLEDTSSSSACMNPDASHYFLSICSGGSANHIPNNWMNACVSLTSTVGYHVETFTQNARIMCKFYDDSNECKGNIEEVSIITEKEESFRIDPEVGKRIKYVMCKIGRWRRDVGEIEGRSDSPSGSPTTIVDADVAKKPWVCQNPHSASAYRYLVVCSQAYAQQMSDIHRGDCMRLSDPVALHVDSFLQDENVVCDFYDNSNGCLGNQIFHSMTREHQYRFDIDSKWGTWIKHVRCRYDDTWYQAGGIEAREIDAFSSPNVVVAPEIVVAPDTDTSPDTDVSPDWACVNPGPDDQYLVVCGHGAGQLMPNKLLGACLELNAGVTYNVDSFLQDSGLMCRFYNDPHLDCKGEPIYIAQTLNKQHIFNIDAKYGTRFKYVQCYKGDHRRSDVPGVEARAARTSLEAPSFAAERATVTTTNANLRTIARVFAENGGPLLVRENYLNYCIKLNSTTAYHVTRAAVTGGIVCRFSEYGCLNDPLIVVGAEHYVDEPVPSDLGKRITHVICERPAAHAEIEARADATSLETTAQKTKMARVFGDTADLYIYDDNDADCVALSKHVANDVVGVQLEAGILCVFYTNACNIAKFPIFRASNVGPGTLHVDIPGYTGRDISHVACGKKHTLDAEIDAWAATTPIIDARAETSPTVDAQAVTTPIFDATALTTLHLDGPEIARVFSKTAMFGIQDEDANTCIPLGDPIANDLFAVAVHENVLCRFWENSCDVAKGPLYQLHSNKGDVASKVPSDIGKQLTHFMCMRTKPQAAIIPRGALDTSMADPGAMAFLFGSTSQLGIYDEDAKKCIPLGDSIAHDLIAVAVPRNVSCSFYKDGCDVSKGPIFLVASGQGRGDVHYVPSEISKRLTHVNCMRTQPHAEIIAREQVSRSNVALITSAASTGNTPDPATDMTITQTQYPRDGYSPVDLAVGSLFTCSYEQTDSCWIMNALNDCLEFPSNTAHNVMILEQAKGSYCWYYNKPGCKDSDEVFHHTSAAENPSAFIGTYFKDLASVVCGGPSVTSELEVIPHDHRIEKVTNVDSRIYAHDISKRDSLPTDSAPAWTLPRAIRVGEVFACSEDHASGCWYINAQNKCTDFPAQVAHKSQFIMQAKGTWCKYYLEAGCSHEAWQYVSTPTDHTTFGVKTNLVASVECQASKVTANEVTKRDWPPGSTTVCHQAHYQFCTDNAINAIQQCANFAPADQGPVSIIQYGGAYCNWYRDFGCGGGEDKAPMSIDSRGGEQWVDDLGVEDRFKSVKCETYQW